MKKGMKRFAALALSLVMCFSLCVPASAQAEDYAAKAGTVEKVDDTWYYYSQNDAEYIFEKVSHSDRGAGEIDGFLDTDDARSQSYAWSAIEYGDYVYVGTCYNSTYGIYWRNVFNMMLGFGKTQLEAMQIARDFVQFMFDDRFDETLAPHGVLIKFHKETGDFSLVYDSKQSSDSAIKTTSCSGYRMAFEFHDKLYFVSLANPTMFLLEIDPEDDGASETCEIAFKRSLSSEGSAKQIAAGVHGLIVYDDEILMCLADEASDGSKWLDGEEHPEGGLIIASKDGRNWRVIADESDLGPSAYHNYDGLMGGGIWDIIEYNGHVYVTVVTDLTDTSTGVVNKQGFALYRGTKGADGEFTWEMMAGDTSKEGVELPYGFGTTYSMACNMWVYDGYLYLGTYNDPMLDFTAIADRGDFSDLYYDLFYSVNLYRMDTNENIEMVAGKANEYFTEVIGNMSEGFGDNANQYVWRMTEHDGKLFIGTYDASVLASAFTQLTDGQLLDMTEEEYLDRLGQLEKLATSFGILEEKYSTVFNKLLGNDAVRNLFNSIQKLVDAGTGKEDPVPAYNEALAEYEAIKDKIVNNSNVPFYLKATYNKLVAEMDKLIFQPADKIFEEISSVIYYYGVNYYMKNATKGFDILVTEDGVNFEVVTNDGLGDPNNHGVRTLTSADNGETLFVGTANPYFGGQMWKTVDTVPTEEPEAVAPDVPTTEDITALEIPVEVVCDTVAEHVVNNTLAGENVTIGDVIETEGVYTVTLTVNVTPYVEEFNTTYGEPVHTQIAATPSIVLTWDAENNVWEAEEDAKVTVEMQEGPSEVFAYTVTFDAGENGTLVGLASHEINKGTSLTTLPSVVANEGYTFTGWKAGDVTYSVDEVKALVFTEDTKFAAVYSLADDGTTTPENPTTPDKTGNDTVTNDTVDTGDLNNIRIMIYTTLIVVAVLSVVLVFEMKKRYKL